MASYPSTLPAADAAVAGMTHGQVYDEVYAGLVEMGAPLWKAQRAKMVGSAVTHPQVLGDSGAHQAAVLTPTANQLCYCFFTVSKSLTYSELGVRVDSAGAAATTFRFGLYQADADWQPMSGGPFYDSGALAADSTGRKSVAGTIAIPAGRYVQALITDSAGAGFRYMATSDSRAVDTVGSAPISYTIGGRTYGAFPSTPQVWTSGQVQSSASRGMAHWITGTVSAFS